MLTETLSDIDPAFSGIVTAFCERTDVFELEKDAVKKVNNHTFEFADVVAGNIEIRKEK